MSNGITKEEIELLKNLQKKVKQAKAQAKEKINTVLNPVFKSINIEEVFKTISMTGGDKISRTIKLDDGRKLKLVLHDVTKVGVEED